MNNQKLENNISSKQLIFYIDLLKYIYNSDKQHTQNIKKKYGFDDIYYFHKKSHLNMFNHIFKSLIAKFFSNYPIIDLQFSIAIAKDSINKNKKNIFIVFKGSDEWHDWLTNMTFKLSHHNQFKHSIHQGFYHSFQLFRRTIKSEVKSVFNLIHDIDYINKYCNITVIGHSLGGSVATLTGCYLYDIGVKKENFSIVTFGAPPIAKKEFCSYYQNKIDLKRIVTQSDPVTKLYLNKLDHIGEKLELNSERLNSHKLAAYNDSIKSIASHVQVT